MHILIIVHKHLDSEILCSRKHFPCGGFSLSIPVSFRDK